MQERLTALLHHPRFKSLGKVVQHAYFPIIIGGLIASLAFLMLVSFVALDWYALQIEIEGIDVIDESRSGLGVMFGTGEDSPFGRTLDILLILIPLSSLALLTIAGLMIVKRFSLGLGLSSAMMLSLLMLVLPSVWQGLSTNNARGELDNNQEALDFFTQGYSTEEQSILGFLLLLICGVAFALHMANQLGLFVEPEPTIPVLVEDTSGGESS